MTLKNRLAVTSHAVVADHIRRGPFESIEAALMLCGLRDFADMSTPDARADALDIYLDHLIPAIVAAGGESVRCRGDALLVYFRRDDATSACEAALDTAFNVQTLLDQSIEPAIALHYGELRCGDIGSGTRFDLTAFGPDVDLIDRIQAVCGTSGHLLLTSERFARLLNTPDMMSIGRYAWTEFLSPVELYCPLRLSA